MFQSAREEATAAIGLLRHGQEGAIETNFLDMPATGAGPEPGVVSLPERRQKWVVLPECAEAVSLEDLERPVAPYRGAVRAPRPAREQSAATGARELGDGRGYFWTGRRGAAFTT